MSETVREWLGKADGDYRTADREFRSGPEANYDAVCFHAQQCIEKLMKAVLVRHGTEVPRTHNLLFLYDLLKAAPISYKVGKEDLEFLTRGGVRFRYPGEWAERKHAERALAICTKVRESLLELVEGESEDPAGR